MYERIAWPSPTIPGRSTQAKEGGIYAAWEILQFSSQDLIRLWIREDDFWSSGYLGVAATTVSTTAHSRRHCTHNFSCRRRGEERVNT